MGKESHSVEAAVKQLKVSAKKRLNRMIEVERVSWVGNSASTYGHMVRVGPSLVWSHPDLAVVSPQTSSLPLFSFLFFLHQTKTHDERQQ
jgi:hypothetical protein